MDEILLVLSDPAFINFVAWLAGAFILGCCIVACLVYVARYFGYL